MQTLAKEIRNRLKGRKRVAVLGVGSEFRGDDEAGMLVAEDIIKRKNLPKAIKVFLGATAPENLTGEIIRFKPTHLIIVDTADISEKPGTILLIKDEDLGEGVSFSTHKLPPKVMMDYFNKKLKCDIMIIGIQPKSLKFVAPVSKEVRSAAKEVANAIVGAVRSKV